MTIGLRRIIMSGAAAAGLVAAMSLGGHGPLSAAAAKPKAQTIVADWPEPSRRMALMMIEKHGQPNRRREDSLTWFGLYRGLRTVVRRTDSSAGVVEQVVRYSVPADKAGAVALFDPRIWINRGAAEMSAHSDNVKTNFLILNLAHEVASGFRSVAEARQLRDKELRLAGSGKSSRYRDGLIFEQPLPTNTGIFVLPPSIEAE